VLDFEKDVVQLFDAHQIDFEFESKEHLLISETLTIIFIPICSIRDYIVPDNLPESTIKTIRIWQDEYMQHKEIIDSRILSLIGISQRVHARQTRVKAIDKLALKHFLIRNHLNVPTSARHRYGLFRQQELVAVAAFGRHCPVQDQGITYRSHELIRYCSLLNTTVVGGLSKLIHHFEKDKTKELSSIKSNFKLTLDKATQDVSLPKNSPFTDWKEARRYAGPLPFTFTYNKETKEVLIIEGVRQNWTPSPVKVIDYNFEFLDTIKLQNPVLANAFVIRNIPYHWKKGKIELWK